MKSLQKPSQVSLVNRQFSIQKEIGNYSMQSPDKHIYCPKTLSQAKIQTLGPSPYMQSPIFDGKYITQNNITYQPSPPQKLDNQYQQKLNTKTLSHNQDVLKPYNHQEIVKTQMDVKSNYETYKCEYNKIYNGNFKSECNKETTIERTSTTLKKDAINIESKENYGVTTKTLTTEHMSVGNNKQLTQNYGFLQQKPKLSTEISKISMQLKDFMSYLQRFVNDGKLPDINDKMMEIQTTFKKLEELSNIDNNENDQKNLSMAEDYNKLKGILEQLQIKMTALVQENQKLNKGLIEQEQKVLEEQKKRQLAEDKANQVNKEFNRVFECLQINQKENEELKMKVQQVDNLNSVKFNQNKIINDDNLEYKQKNQKLQKEFDLLESKYKQLLSEKTQQKDIPKSPLMMKSIHQSTSKQQEQLELKLLYCASYIPNLFTLLKFKLQLSSSNMNCSKFEFVKVHMIYQISQQPSSRFS